MADVASELNTSSPNDLKTMVHERFMDDVWGTPPSGKDKNSPEAVLNVDVSDRRALKALSDHGLTADNWIFASEALYTGKKAGRMGTSDPESLAFEFGTGLVEGQQKDPELFFDADLPADKRYAVLEGYYQGLRMRSSGVDGSNNQLLVELFKLGAANKSPLIPEILVNPGLLLQYIFGHMSQNRYANNDDGL